MSHSLLPVDEIQKNLQSAVEEFLIASREIEKEQNKLEGDISQEIDRQKSYVLKKRLGI